MDKDAQKRLIGIVLLVIFIAVAIGGYLLLSPRPTVLSGSGDASSGSTIISSSTDSDDSGATGDLDLSGVRVPTFDVIRLEADGSLVIAGNAALNSQVDLITQTGDILDTTQAESGGDFVFIPDSKLPSGDYILHLESILPDGRRITSAQTATLHVPAADDDVLVIVNEAGQPSRILIKPKSLASPTPQDDATPPILALDESTIGLTVEAVEVEDNQIYIAGKVKSGLSVRLYLDHDLLGTVVGNSQNRFLLETEYDLQSGPHSVRADVIDISEEDSGKVLSRAEVALLHETPLEKGVSSSDVIRTGTHVISIERGDTLWHISQRTYGAGIRYTTIYNANKDQIRNPDLIYVGQVFKIPEKPDDEAQ